MAIPCPNTSTKKWKQLVDHFGGDDDARGKAFVMYAWHNRMTDADSARIPSVKEVKQMLEPPPSTPLARVHDELRKSFLGRGFDNLTRRGKLNVIQTEAELPAGVRNFTRDKRVVGAYDPASKKVYLVADNVKPGDAEYVMRHEAVHALLREDPLFMKAKDQILKDFAHRIGTDASVKAAFDRVPKGTDGRIQTEEAFAYWMQDPANHDLPWMNRLWSAMKAALYRLGIPVGKLSKSDLAELFTQGTKAWAEKGDEGAAAGAGKALNADRAKALFSKVEQAISSAATSIPQVAALFKKPWAKLGPRNVDIGGGKFDLGTEYLKEKGVDNKVYDPFNRTKEHNDEVVRDLAKEPADTATITNVLNVIKEPEIRSEVIRQAAKAIKKEGIAYFQIHEGDADGNSRITKQKDGVALSWQNHRPTVDYVDEVKEHFGDVTRKGSFIIAKDPVKDASMSLWGTPEKPLFSLTDKAKSVIDEDITPEIKKATGMLTDIGRGIQKLFYPQALGPESKEIGQILVHQIGKTAHRRESLSKEFDDIVSKYDGATTKLGKFLDVIQSSASRIADRVFNRMSKDEQLAFMDREDRGIEQPTPMLKEMSKTINGLFKEMADKVQKLDTGALETIIKNYFPHIFTKPMSEETARMILSKRPFEGSKGFTKQRTFEFIKDALDAGYELKSYNPLDNVFMKLHEMQKYVNAHTTLQEGEKRGIVAKVIVGEKAPAGMVDIAGPYGITTKYTTPITKAEFVKSLIQQGMPKDEAYAYATDHGKRMLAQGKTEFAKKETYRYVTTPDVAQVVNNYLSQTLYSNPYVGSAYKAYMGIANNLNMFQLGMGSAFHAGFTTANQVINHFGLGIKALADGHGKEAAKYFITAPTAGYTALKKGMETMDAYLAKTDGKEMTGIVKWLELAGARKGLDNRFQTDNTAKLMQDFSNGKYIKAALRTPFAFAEQSARPILEWLVPRQKFGAFAEMANYWIKNHPEAEHAAEGTTEHAELKAAMQQIWNRVDSQLGQVAYDRLFINNAAKNVLQGLMRAPAWTGGTLLEVGGGALDITRGASNLVRGKKFQVTDRMAYTMSLAISTMAANALMTMAFTGEKPEDKDFFGFRTGSMDERGNPERFMFPTYMKDVTAWTSHPGTTLTNKLHPLIALMEEIYKNKDYYGKEIRGEHDNFAEQVGEVLKFGVKAFVPFWMLGEQKVAQRGGSILAKALPLVGIMPAPASEDMTATQRLTSELVRRRLPEAAKTSAEYEKAQLKSKLTQGLRNKTETAQSDLTQAFQEKKISLRDMTDIRRSARVDPLISGFNRLSYADAKYVYDQATDEEKAQLRVPLMKKKVRAAQNNQNVNEDEED